MKQAKQLKCDVNSKQFRDILRYVWMPRLLERVQSDPNGPDDILPRNAMHNSVLETEGPKQNNSSSVLSSTSSDSSVEFQVPSKLAQNDSLEMLGHDDPAQKGSELCSSFNNQVGNNGGGGDSLESLWNDESMWFLQQLSDDLQIKYNSFA